MQLPHEGFETEGSPMSVLPAFFPALASSEHEGLPSDIVEVAFLLPDAQVKALEEMAHGRGLTAGQLLRNILGDFFNRFATPSRGLANRLNGSSAPF